MRTMIAILVCLMVSTAAHAQSASNAATVNNDDSCDIGVYPAATLLLPYFEQDVSANAARTTIFSITNVSALPQIARVTIWTDWAYPLLTFNLFLTGYDTQPINLYDIIVRGLIGGTIGTSTSSPNARMADGTSTNPNLGTTPLTNLANPNFLATVGTDCAPGRLPGAIPASLVQDVVSVLTTGRSKGSIITCPGLNGQEQIGFNHGSLTAIGYVTVDVVATCSAMAPTDLRYFTSELLFDNVLTGDYQEVVADATRGNYAGGNPMVHVRAVPEGGGVGSVPTGVTNLPFTFYDRFTVGAIDRRIDRRQPLPSTFATRWISGGPTAFETLIQIWREGMTGSNAACTDYSKNGQMPLFEFVRFDERENAAVIGSGIIIGFPPPPPTLPAVSRTSTTSSLFPYITSTDPGGWLYLDLDNGGSSQGAPYSAARNGLGTNPGSRDVSQNWVVVSMFAEGRYGVSADATSLGNGCSPAYPPTMTATEASSAARRLGPSGGVIVCPPGTTPTNGDATACRGRNVNP